MMKLSPLQKLLPLLLLLLTTCIDSFAGPGDTVVVQAFTFGSKQDSVIKFPPATQSFQKILMYYTLKCNSNQNPACGEWDYLTYTYVYKPTGTYDSSVTKVDTIWNVDSSSVVDIDTSWNVYEKLDRFEIGRYITPYGIGLNLGTNGFRWIFDVSDYRSLLVDSVRLSAGNWQELLDLKFIFIEGTPPRETYKVANLWTGHPGYSTNVETFLSAKNVGIDQAAVNTRLKIRVTGHGFGGNENCAEFCPKNHFMFVNGTQRWTKLVWRDNCAFNPVYPQGGTWVYQRANWCPGAEVETYDMELTPWVTPGSSATLDYNIDPYTWNGQGSGPYYALETQLVSYHAPAFTLDAAMENIISPTTEQVYARLNPNCADPVIIIRNTGTTTLTSLDITYGVTTAPQRTYTWNGNLEFMQTDTVVLPQPDWGGVTAGNANFIAVLSKPNGGSDQYAFNNTVRSSFVIPPRFDSRFIVLLRTNNNGNETSYTIKNDAGQVVYSRSNMGNNILYKDTVDLLNGCWEFRLTDAGEDGLSWWANTAQGSGSLKFLKINGQAFRSYNSDFGGEIRENFTTGHVLSVNENPAGSFMEVYPNPASTELNIEVFGNNEKHAKVSILAPDGRTVVQQTADLSLNGRITFDLSDGPAGIYFVRMITSRGVYQQKFVLLR
jgi:hypothetical protein